MPTWPESSPTPVYPFIVSARFNTSIIDLGGGIDRRRAEDDFALYDVRVSYKALTAAEMQVLWNFFLARKGANEAFYIYDLGLLASVAPSHVGELVGIADGYQDTFDLPGRTTSGRTVYLDDVEETGLTYSTGTGEASADQIVFTSPPSSGAVIKADFSGFLRMLVRFKSDTFGKDLFVNDLYSNNLTIELEGLNAQSATSTWQGEAVKWQGEDVSW